MSNRTEHPVSPPMPSESQSAVPPPPPAPRRSLRSFVPWLVTLTMIVAIIGLVLALLLRQEKPLPPPSKVISSVATMELVPRSHFDALELPARLKADRQTVISAELAGRIEEWRVTEGATVEKDQILVRLNTDGIDAKIEQLKASRNSAEKGVEMAQQDTQMAKVGVQQATRDAEALDLELQSAQARLKLANRELERIERLAADNIATQADLDRAENEQTQARLDVEKAKDARERAQIAVTAAEVALAQAGAALALNRTRVQEVDRQIDETQVSREKMTIQAPYAGRFDEHLAEVGDVVSPGQPLGRLYDLEYLRVAVDVSDRYAPLMDPNSPMVETYLTMAMEGAKQDLKAAVVIPGLPKLTGGTYAGIELPADIDRISQAADPSSNTFRVELRLKNPGGALKEGIIANAKIAFLRYENAVVIPLKAVQVTDRGTRVLVAVKQEERTVARVRNVQPVSISGDSILVTGELRGGEHLIISGTKGIIDGEEINVVFSDGDRPADKEAHGRIQANRYGTAEITVGEKENEAN